MTVLEAPVLRPRQPQHRATRVSRGRPPYDRLTMAMIGAGLLANALILLHADLRWILPTLGLLLALALPTRLLSKVFKRTIYGPGIRIPLALALTLLALMVGGLLLNTVLPRLGDPHPLGGLPVLGFVDAFNAAIIVVRPRCIHADVPPRTRLRALERALLWVTVLDVALAVIGAVRLNNGAGGGVAEAALGVAGILGVVLMVVAARVRPGVLVACLYGIALAVLYMTSLRGWYTTGHDIQVEFRVFSLVHATQHWSVSSAGTSYNACLSITILPQMLWELTRVATPYVFKTDFPLIFAACPLALYELSRRILGRRLAIASVLLFISFPTFVNDMVFINRQEVAFLFVSVVMALMFCGGSDLLMRRIIIGLCIVGMVMSHYSTSYVFLATILVALFGLALSRFIARWAGAPNLPAHARLRALAKLGRSSSSRLSRRPGVFNWALVGFTCLLVVAWTFVDIQATPAFNQNLRQALGAFIGNDGSGSKSVDVNYSVASAGNNASVASQLDAYTEQLQQQVGRHPVRQGYYPKSVLARYATPPGPPLRSGSTAVGRALERIGIDPYQLNSILRSVIARLFQLLALLGVLVVFFGWRKSVRVTARHVYIAMGSVVLLAASVVLPVLSVNYGLLRMFQQALLILAPFVVIGVLFAFGLVGLRRVAALGACVVTAVFFFSLTGLMPQITGSFVPQLNLNNAGEYYENYYTQPQEVAAMRWLDTVATRDSVVQTDPFATARFQPYTSIGIDDNDFPTVVLRHSYVVLGTDTVQSGISTVGPNDALLDYEYPVAFLEANKDLIYASNGAEIFHS